MTALFSEIKIEKGRVVQSNYHDYPILRMNHTPKIEVYIVENDNYPPGGVGEPAVPIIAPAVADAVYRAIGTRFRRIPFNSK